MKRLAAVMAVAVLAVPLAWGANGLGLFWSYYDMAEFENGWGGGAKLKLQVAPGIFIEARGTYLANFYDEGVDEDFSIVPVEGDLLIEFPIAPDQFFIYGGGGGGYYITPKYTGDHAVGGPNADIDPDDSVGFFAIAGAQINLSPQAGLFAEGKYVWLKVDELRIEGDDYDTAEDNWGGWGFNAGLVLLW